MSRVVLAMSGGVDSSVAAHLLREAGHDVVGLFMRHGEMAETACATVGEQKAALLPILPARADHKQGCCSATDADDARRVAERLEIPFYALNFEEEFGRIIDYFVEEYTNARTPNPCVVCNNWLKFGKLFDYADSVGAEFVATGHYARLEFEQLLRGLDADKDQSYVLFGVAREHLPRMLFPVGGHRKEEIRRLAGQIGLRVADKRDSQEICFVTSGDHADFIRRRTDYDTAGEIVTTDGAVVGRHEGIEAFTIGQRKGLGVALGEPRYVVRIEAESRRVVIGTHDELARDSLTANRTNWLVDEPTGPVECLVQIRYNSQPVPATILALPDRRLQVRFDEPRHGVAPGQAVVCYDGERVLGGGWIE
jgi:tRNA-specific 2-thiouridylase